MSKLLLPGKSENSLTILYNLLCHSPLRDVAIGNELVSVGGVAKMVPDDDIKQTREEWEGHR